MSECYFDSVLQSLLKPQEKERLYKILVAIRNNVEWPKDKGNITKICDGNCLKSLIICLQQPCLKIINVTLSILGNCCMDRRCARISVKQYNLLKYLSQILNKYNQDSIRGRIFRIIGNMCQHWERLANNLLEKESQLKIIAKLVEFLKSVGDINNEAWKSDVNIDNMEKPSPPTIIMGVRALKELANMDTITALIQLGVLEAVGIILITFTPLWLEYKLHEDILQVVLRLIHTYSKYKCPNTIAELQNTVKGNSMPWLGKLVSLSPYKIYNLIVNLMGVATATSDLPFITISEDLLEKLQNPLAFTKGREDLNFREHLKCLCFFVQNPGIRKTLNNHKVILVLLIVLRDISELTHLTLKNTILLIAALRAYMYDDNLLQVQLKNGIVDILSEKMDWVINPSDEFDLTHEYKMKKSPYISRKRSRAGISTSDIEQQFPIQSTGSYFCCHYRKVRSCNREIIGGRLSPSSDISFSSGPSYDGVSSPDLSELDDQSDSDDYSPVCSDIECDRSTQSVRVETGNLLNYMDNEEIEESTTTAAALNRLGVTDMSSLKKELTIEIVKLYKAFILLQPAPVELITPSELLIKLLKLCLPWNKNVCPSNTMCVVNSIIETPQFLVKIMQTNFVNMAYKLTVIQHGVYCNTCLDLQTIGRDILTKLTYIVENKCGKGDIAHHLYRATLPVKQKLAATIPFVAEKKAILSKLMNECGGLNVLLQFFKENSEERLTCINGLANISRKLEIKNPTKVFDDKLNTVLSINIENYNLSSRAATIVGFLLDDGNCIYADRNFLSEKSQYFQQLLSGTFKESTQEKINLHNITTNSLKFLLMLLEHDLNNNQIYKFNVDLEILLDVIVITDRYLLDNYCLCLTASVQTYTFLPSNIPTIYQWSLESGTDILRIEAVAYALIGSMTDVERNDLFYTILQLGYTDSLIGDIKDLLMRHLTFS